MSIYHTCIDRTPYAYLIGWPEANLWYYGCRYAKACHPSDIMVTYMTSSKSVKQYIKQHGLPTVVKARKVFNTATECRQWEARVLRRMHVVESDNWFNKNDKAAPPHMAGENHPGFNTTHTAERRLKNSESNKKAWAAKSAAEKLAHATAIGDRVRGTKQSAEHIRNRIVSGEQHYNWGKRMTEEENALKSARMKTIVANQKDTWPGTTNLLESIKRRMADGTHPSQIVQVCPHCNRSIKGKSSYSQFHGNNCKLNRIAVIK